MKHRCRERDDRPMFNLRHCTVIEGSKIKHSEWAVSIYLSSAKMERISSMQLCRGLKIGQKAGWFLRHRLRTALRTNGDLYSGPVEADEKFDGGSRKSVSNAKRKDLKEAGFSQAPAGKTVVDGVKDHDLDKVVAKGVEKTDAVTRQGFVKSHNDGGAQFYTDEATPTQGMTNRTRRGSIRLPNTSGT